MKKPATRDPEATKTAILEAARTLFLEKGFSAVPTSEIARRAGVTKSLIYHHFGAKGDLWRAVKGQMFAECKQLQAEMIKSAGKPSIELLEDSLRSYFHYFKENSDIARLIAWIVIDPSEAGDDSGDEVNKMAVEYLARGQSAGILRDDIDSRTIFVVLLGMVEHYFLIRDWLRATLPMDEMPVADMDRVCLDGMTKILIDGVRARSAG